MITASQYLLQADGLIREIMSDAIFEADDRLPEFGDYVSWLADGGAPIIEIESGVYLRNGRPYTWLS